ncbi:unnamed protein product [Symbiodinium sp. CCMP2592]|nr:unnamed protein product [Symbiodinium sp. CCMP2592]
MLREERSRLWPPSESPAKGEATSSLQRPQSKEVISREFNLRLGGWFPALKWLIKEFRLRIGYETPDEEAIRPETASELQHRLSMTGWHPLLDPTIFPWPGPYWFATSIALQQGQAAAPHTEIDF